MENTQPIESTMNAVSEAASATAGRLIYAVGDIHGRLDALDALLEIIVADARAWVSTSPPVIVLLGDYVDRGPSSKGVLDAIIALKAAGNAEVVTLKGNHEQALLRFLDDARFGPEWASYGAAATLASYGVIAPRLRMDQTGWERTRAEFEARLPGDHILLLRRLENIRVIGDFAFVHAGIRPDVPLSDQSEDDLIWIREPFIRSHTRHEKVIVHGHSLTEEPYDSAYRIGVDTGAYATGLLTAVRLEGSTRAFLQTGSARDEGSGQTRPL